MLDLNEIEILQVALAHEGRAKAFYDRLAARHGGDPAGELFAFLAGEEEGHIRKLSSLHGIPAFEAGWEAKYLPYLIDLDRLAWEEGIQAEAASGADAARKGLAIARKAETHAIEFYGKAAEVAEDRDTKELLAGLQAEERIHLARIDGLLNQPRPTA
ncbi:MAG: ferritin-like domain-containing protein [Gemmatimonadota bacterium]